MIDYIDGNKDEFGVEPICRELPIAPQIYYAARNRPPLKRAVSDEETAVKINPVHGRAGLMSREGLRGVSRAGNCPRP